MRPSHGRHAAATSVSEAARVTVLVSNLLGAALSAFLFLAASAAVYDLAIKTLGSPRPKTPEPLILNNIHTF